MHTLAGIIVVHTLRLCTYASFAHMRAVVYKDKGNASGITRMLAHTGFSHRSTVRTRGYTHTPAFLIGVQSAHAGYGACATFLTGVQFTQAAMHICPPSS
jgi:hypothetical protein